jgi:hypothetical protein
MDLLRLLALVPAAALAACSTPSPALDAGDTGPVDAAPEGGGCDTAAEIHSLHPGPLYVRQGTSTQVMLRLARDRSPGCPAEFTIQSEDPATLRADASVRVEPPRGSVLFNVTGVALGRTRLRVTQVGHSEPRTQAVLEVTVLPETPPACPSGTQASGRLMPGGRVAGAAGSPLEAASVTAQASLMDPGTDVTIACAPDQVPEGYDAVGPAIAFGPRATPFSRELPITIPINPALVPTFYELHAEVAWKGPGMTAPRIVALANTRFTLDGKALEFEAPRLGTYQAVVRHGLGTRRVRKRMTWRAILGVSMGALGTSMLGTRNPELFDFILPLGGPADWGFFGDYFRNSLLGGFCTAEDRARPGNEEACAQASTERTPTPTDLWVADQHFEWFNYPDGRGGQGGTFDRRSYVQIFRDLTHMFGNAVLYPDDVNGVLPRGVPASELTRSDAERCASPVVLNDYYDDEFNPTGEFPVITFCDGNRTPAHAGEWAGGQGAFPFEVSLAVDYNRNGVRDRGEPVLRNFGEPFDDFGADGLRSVDEPGYHPETNPDPAGDDYDRQYNPGGTEGNFVRDEGERFQDVGVDGIACPAGRTCPYDFGEGNGRYDVTPGMHHFLDRNPRARFAALPSSEARRLGVWADGGTRDLFNFGAVANHFVGAISQQGADLHIYNNFSSLITGRPVPANNDEGFVFTDVDYAHLPHHVMLRYGFDDASDELVRMGDGGHVGTVDQITHRLYLALWWMQSRWPGGNRTITSFSGRADNEGRCANGYFCTFDFRSERADRTGPVSIVLPPGYHRPENASETYPVVFFLHGYGQEPQDLLASGLLVGNHMGSGTLGDWQRPAKFIMVFPDGRCREGDGCLRGTFYTDSPNAGNARMETYFLDLYDFIARSYRARPAEEVEVLE